MEKYYKIKCKECGKVLMVSEDNVPTKNAFRSFAETVMDEENYICKKCRKEIEAKRVNHCGYCGKDFKPSDRNDYADICQKCYNFIMNDYEPKGLMKKVFDVLPCDDGHLDWEDIAKIKYDVYELLKK